MCVRQPTFFELQQLEEQKLFENLEYMNSSFKKKDKKSFLKAVTDIFSENGNLNTLNETLKFSTTTQKNGKRSLSFDTLDNMDIKNLTLNKSSLTSSMSTNPSISINNPSVQNIIKQNLVLSEEVVKLILIGDKAVGKSLFINRMINETDNSIIDKYIPTSCLEIQKHLFKILGKNLKVEFIDTNVFILNSNIIQTYLKISHGFVLICDVARRESIKLIEKMLDYIIPNSLINQNIHIIANIRDETDLNQYQMNLEYLNALAEKINIKPQFINLKEYSFKNDIIFQKFVNGCSIRGKGCRRMSKRQNHKKQISLNIDNSPNNTQQSQQHKNHDNHREMSASPKKCKKDSCSIY
jgi:hypothetical protein